MRFKGFLLILLLIFCERTAFGQKAPELTQSRILILLDQSSSMLNTWSSGRPKYKAARQLILSLMDSVYAVNDKVEFSLRVFGHQHTVAENFCFDTKNEVPFTKRNRTQMELRLEDITPLGVTAIAYSLQQAAQYDLVDETRNAYSIILITDGGESCGGNICEVMQTLIKNKVYFKPYIVSLENYPELKNTYNCMGDYLQVTADADIPKAVNTIVSAFRPIIKLTPQEYKQIIASAPSILKVNVPEVKMPTTEPEKPKDPPPPPAIRPAGDKIKPLASAALVTMKVTPVPHVVIKKIRANLVIPPVKYDDPPPPPPVVRPAPVTIARITPLASKKYTTFNEYNWEKLKPMTVTIKVPPVVYDTPKPVVVEVKRPAPEKIGRLTASRARSYDITLGIPARMKTLTVPPMPKMEIEVPAPPPPPTPVGGRPGPEKIARATPAARKPVAATKPAAGSMKTLTVPPMPVMEIDVPAPPPPVVVRPGPEKIARATPAARKPVPIAKPAASRMKTARVPALPAFTFDIPAPPAPVVPPPPPVVVPKRPAPEKIARVELAKRARMNVIFVSDQGNIRTRKVPPFPKMKIDGPPPAPVTGSPNISIETEVAKETIVEVYLTDGKGKFYTASPFMTLTDPSNPKNTKSFFRTTDMDGKPDPQILNASTYNLTFQKNKDLVKNNIRVEPNKKTKIMVVIKPVSIIFQYNGAPNRPVKEFSAQVIERNKKKGRVQEQPCTERMEYEPGNYHVTFNTFPAEKRNVDLDVEGASVVYIDQPGFVKFTSEDKTIVTLWKEDGDRFAPFHKLDLNDPRSQHLQIQPGKYQVHYRKGPGGPAQSEKVKAFSIFATRDTEVVLD